MAETPVQGCPFCVENGMVAIIAQTDRAYLIAVRNGAEVVTGCFFIIPKQHVESVLDLPDDWQAVFNELLWQAPGISGSSFNVSYNSGRAAGQRVAHVHAWVVLRSGEEGKPSHELGFAALIRNINAHQ